MPDLASLPPEIIREVVSYLPVPSLHAFGLTSKYNHGVQLCSLTTLRLGVFPSRLAGMISLMEAAADSSSTHSVQMVLPKSDSTSKEMIIRNQNAAVREVVEKHKHTLRNLEIALWDLQPCGAKPVVGLNNLRALAIRLDHPHTRHLSVDRHFWDTSPPSTVWNSFFASPNEKGVLGRLQSMTLERAGITDFQLQQMLKENPMITNLRLRKCLVLTRETFEYLGENDIGGRLETFHFTSHAGGEIDDGVLDYIDNLVKLKVYLAVQIRYTRR